MKKKLTDNIYIIFFKKAVMDDLNWWLAVPLLENKYCTEKDDYCFCKNDDRLPHQKSTFYIGSKGVSLLLFIWSSSKVLKCLLQNIQALLDLTQPPYYNCCRY